MTSFFVKEGQEALEEISKEDPNRLAVLVLKGQGLSEVEAANKILATKKIDELFLDLEEVLSKFRDIPTRESYSKDYTNELLTKGSFILSDKSLPGAISLLEDLDSEIHIYRHLLNTAKSFRNVQSLAGLTGSATSPSFDTFISRTSMKLSQLMVRKDQKELMEELSRVRFMGPSNRARKGR